MPCPPFLNYKNWANSALAFSFSTTCHFLYVWKSSSAYSLAAFDRSIFDERLLARLLLVKASEENYGMTLLPTKPGGIYDFTAELRTKLEPGSLICSD